MSNNPDYSTAHKSETYAAGIALVKSGTVVGGCDAIEFTYTVTNESTLGEVLENVVVSDPIFGDLAGPDSGDDNNNTFLDPGETWIYVANHNITQTDINNGQVVGQANVNADVQGQPGVTVMDLSDDDSPLEDDTTIIDLSSCPNISVIKKGTALDGIEGNPGCNLILYNFTVNNEGGVPLENVVLDDPLLGGEVDGPFMGDDNDDGILDIDETWLYSGPYITTQTDKDNEQVVNQATVIANVQGDPGAVVSDLSDDDSPSEDDPTVIDLPSCQSNISVIKTGAALDGIEGNPGCNLILYNFAVNNEGDVPLENVVLDDPLLGGEVDGPFMGDDNDDGILDIDETWLYSGPYITTQADKDNQQVVNQATVSANVQGDPGAVVSDLSDDDSPFEDDPTVIDLPSCQISPTNLGMIKEGTLVDIDQDGCIDSILYTFTVTNTGSSDLEQITLEDDLFGGEIPGPVEGTDDGNDGMLSAGETWSYEALYGITQADIDQGSVINQATVNGLPVGQDVPVSDLSDDDSLEEDEPTRTPVPDDVCPNDPADMGMIKEAELVDIDQDGCIDSILYTFTVTNTGSSDLEQITLEDDLFGGEISGPVEGTDDGNDGILSSGETWTYQALYAITQADIDQGSVINQATVNGIPVGMNLPVFDLSDDDSLIEDEPTRTPVPDDACPDNPVDMGLIKEGTLTDIDQDGCIDSILYTFIVTNTGETDLGQIVLEDELFGGEIPGPVAGTDEGDDGILSVDETWTYQALYAITQADIDQGSVINQATVNGILAGLDLPVFDLSDDDSLEENGVTRTLVPDDACPDDGDGTPLFGIAIIKTGVGQDVDFDGCDDSIEYNFSVTNSGSTNLESIVLTDDMLGEEINGPLTSEATEDGILQPGEEWIYTATYNLTQEDISGIFVENQATVTANLINTDITIFDNSDNDSYLENEITSINVSSFCEFTGGGSGFEIFNGITPNGDGSNDFFRIQGIENYPDNNVKIFNRWGVLVYQTDSYGQGNNLFYGIPEGRATLQKEGKLPSGTYFYILTFTSEDNPGEESYSGYLYINRN
ncbi:gliding motility-associated C-terminal domain-containing protein [Flagellimonas ruestringensis]|nr:gliding motility-associated C-terminal domain-containing protein [Allomuricauda ruestringensis]